VDRHRVVLYVLCGLAGILATVFIIMCLVLYVLCGLAGILATVFIIMCFQYGRLFSLRA